MARGSPRFFILSFARNDNLSKIKVKIYHDFEILPKIGNFELIIKAMGRNTSISLGNHFENFIENSLSEGRFKNASEVVRAGLRLLEEEENKLIILKKAVQDGIDSGRAENFNAKKHLESLKAKRKNG
jgi:antitoxin ParD1/3/4